MKRFRSAVPGLLSHPRRACGTGRWALPLVASAAVFAGGAWSPLATAQYPHESKVELRWDRWYDYGEMTQALKDLEQAYPELLTLRSLGKSVGGRDIWLVILNNDATGSHTSKPAMFIDGNIHGNEIQAAEVVLYSIWFLTKSYGKIDKITRLVDERSFYFVPMENPDGREVWFHEPATPNYLRGGIKPVDNDHDGTFDEDPADDLDGDGHITQMWVRDPLGRFKRDPKDDRFFIRVADDEAPGGWSFLGEEGIDNDDDGRVNEDGPGGYDPNRNWGSDWQPNYVQGGAHDYPFSLPETRAVAEFVMKHPNIAGYQSYHNTGGMILAGPGSRHITYPAGDVQVFQELQRTGSAIIPLYREYVIHQDLYTVHGGESTWAYEALGILSFTNELWTTRWMYYSDDRVDDEESREFRDLLQFGEVYTPLTEVEHPTYGKVLVGGTKKWSSRIAPPWIQQEELHRNFAFTMYHADEMPQVKWGAVEVRRMQEGGLWQVTVEVKNDKAIPTILDIARRNRIGARDSIRCRPAAAGDGGGAASARVVASGTVSSLLPWSRMTFDAENRRPDQIFNAGGIRGRSSEMFRFIVEGEGAIEIVYRSQKGGTITQRIALEPREASVENAASGSSGR